MAKLRLMKLLGKRGIRMEKGLVGFVVMNEFYKDDAILFNPEHKNKASYVDSFVIAEPAPQIFKVHEGNVIKRRNLKDFLFNSFEKNDVFRFNFFENICNLRQVSFHIESYHLLNSSTVNAFLFPDLSSFEIFSPNRTASFATDAFTSRLKESCISDISFTFLINSSSFTSSSVSANACLAIDDQLIQSTFSIFSLSMSGIDSVIVPMYNLYTKDVFKSFVCTEDTYNVIEMEKNINENKMLSIDNKMLSLIKWKQS